MPNRQDMINALRNAHEAGDTESAQRIASMLKGKRSARGQRGGARGSVTPTDVMNTFTDVMFGGTTRPNEPSFDIDPYQEERGLEEAFIPGMEMAALFSGVGRAAARNVPKIGSKELAKIAENRSRTSFIRDLVQLYPSKKNKMKMVENTEVVGRTKKFVRNLTDDQKRAAQALADTPEIKPGILNQEAYNIADKEISRLGNELTKIYEFNNVPISQGEIEKTIEKSLRILKARKPRMRRAGKRMEDLKEDALSIISQDSRKDTGTTLADLYKSRKGFDAEYGDYKNIANQMASETSTADEEIWRTIRASMNALIDAKSPNQKAFKMRQKQRGLYIARDDILKDKARIERETMLQRGLEKLQDVKDQIIDTRATIKPGR